MKHAAEPEVLGGLSIFEKTCVYCGARFRVLATQSPEHNRSRDYDCPDCGKEYHLQALDPPEVQLLKPRSDGKLDRYQDTMF